MREIIYYKKEKQNLCSIKSVEDNYSGRLFFRQLLQRQLNSRNRIFVSASKPCYSPEASIELLKTPKYKLEELYLSNDSYEVYFHAVSDDLDHYLIDVVTQIWFDFEQLFICIIDSEAILDGMPSIRDRNTTWRNIILLYNSCVLFKQVEEDVIWIGKSSNFILDLPSVDHESII